MPRDSSDNAETGRVHDYLAIYYWEVWQVRKRLFIISPPPSSRCLFGSKPRSPIAP